MGLLRSDIYDNRRQHTSWGGGSAVDTSIVDTSSLGFNNVQEFADYVLAQMNNKVNSDKLGEYVHNQFGEWVNIQSYVTFVARTDQGTGEYEGGEFRLGRPLLPDTCKLKDDIIVDVYNEDLRFVNYNYDNDNTWRFINLQYWRMPSNYTSHIMHTAWCRPVIIQSGAPAETNFLWAY